MSSYYVLSDEKTEKSLESFTSNGVDALITFILPTLQRDTLSRTLQSLLNQTVPLWKAIVLFDGCFPTYADVQHLLRDIRFLPVYLSKRGVEQGIHHACAGSVRNVGLPMVTSPWIGFVDDDDTLHPHYVGSLITERRLNPQADVILFRMIHEGQLYPSADCTQIKQGSVGISFAMKTSLAREGFLFHPSETEDYELLQRMVDARKKIVISPFVMYFVRSGSVPIPSIHSLPRVRIYP